MSPTSYHCSTPRPPMLVADPGTVKPPASSPPLQDGAQDEQRHDRDEPPAEDVAVHVERRLPGGLAVADDVHPGWLRGEPESRTPVALRVATTTTTATDLGGRDEDRAV